MDLTMRISLILGTGVFLIGFLGSFIIDMDVIGLLCLSIMTSYIFWMISRFYRKDYRLGIETIILLILAQIWVLYQVFDSLLMIASLCLAASLCHLLISDLPSEFQNYHWIASLVWAGVGGFLAFYQSIIVGTWGGATIFVFEGLFLLGIVKIKSITQFLMKFLEKIKNNEILKQFTANQNLIFLIGGIFGILFTLSVFLEIAVFSPLIIGIRMFVYITLRNWQNCILFFLIVIAVLIEPSEELENFKNQQFYRKVLVVVFGVFFIGIVYNFSVFLSNFDPNPFTSDTTLFDAAWWGIVPTIEGWVALRAWQALLGVGVSFSYPIIVRSFRSSFGHNLFFVVCCILELIQLIWFLTY